MMNVFTSSYFLLQAISLLHVDCERETILRTNWGVHFDEVGSIISEHQLSYYIHSFVFPKPKLTYEPIKTFNCSNHLKWYILCQNQNHIIQNNNIDNYETFSQASHTFHEAIAMIPQRNKTQVEEYAYKHAKHRKLKRKKRGLFGWFKSIGNAFTDLFHMPGSRDLDMLETHLKEVNKAFEENTKSIKLFNNDMLSTQILFNNRISNLMVGLKEIQQEISDTQDKIDQTFSQVETDINILSERTNTISSVETFLTYKFDPALVKAGKYIDNLFELSSNWYEGIITLYKGLLSPWFVSHEQMDIIINHIQRNVLKQQKYAHLSLLHKNVDFYYKQKNIIVTNNKDAIIILVKFPLKQIGGLLKVYNSYTFPVPLSSGMKRYKNNDNYENSYSKITSIPPYFAISDDGEYYLSLTSELYNSCDGKDLKICRLGMPILRHANTDSCISALFFDNTKGINEKCKFNKIDTPFPGTGQQLVGGNDTFLIHAGLGNKDVWRLRCISNGEYKQKVLKPYPMCRIKMPCHCSFGSQELKIGARLTECSNKNDYNGNPEITYLHHINLATVTSLYPDHILSQVHSYEAKINSLYPPLNISLSNIISSDWTDVIAKDISNEQDFKKITKASMQKITSYETKEEEVKKKITDFSDVTVDRSTDILKAVRDLFGVFGNFGHVVAFIFSEFGLSLIALFLSLIGCVPLFFWDINACCHKDSKKNKTKYIPLVNHASKQDQITFNKKKAKYIPFTDDRLKQNETQYYKMNIFK